MIISKMNYFLHCIIAPRSMEAKAQNEQEIIEIPRFNEENKPFEVLLEDFIDFVVEEFTKSMSTGGSVGPFYFYNIVVGEKSRTNRHYYLDIVNNYTDPNSYLSNALFIRWGEMCVHYMQKMKIKDSTNMIDYVEVEDNISKSNVVLSENTESVVDITNIVSKYFNKSAFMYAHVYSVVDITYDDATISVTFSFANASVTMRTRGHNVNVKVILFPSDKIEFNYVSEYSKELVEQADLERDGSYHLINERLTRTLETETFMLYIEEMIALDLFKNVRKTLHIRPAVVCKEY